MDLNTSMGNSDAIEQLEEVIKLLKKEDKYYVRNCFTEISPDAGLITPKADGEFIQINISLGYVNPKNIKINRDGI